VSTRANLTEPVDPAIKSRLAEAGLRMDLVDAHDPEAAAAFSDAANRGFHGGALSPERHAEYFEANKARRNTGVWDDSLSSLEPVGTSNSWISRLAVPGGRTIDSWAISSVTVASTHHKRGIARALMEAELAAAAKHAPMAMLTVSESSLYQRYGFAPAAFAADYEFDIRRTQWSGPIPDGRVEYISLEEFARELGELHERLVPTRPGMIDIWPLRITQLAGISAADEDRAKKLRAIRFVDADGTTRGIANYRVTGGDEDFVKHTLTVETLVIETPDAGAALWRYLLEVPLVEKVKVEHRPLDEPVQWMITDWRAANVTLWEHQYLRILDVKAVLEARTYTCDGEIVFEVDDAYGYAAGRWRLSIRDGAGRVAEAEADAAGPRLRLGVAELSAIYLTGVSAPALLAAGRIDELGSNGVSIARKLMRSDVTPFLSIWY
jgi:predicted acetyltransferase